jgi:hypothetical protein
MAHSRITLTCRAQQRRNILARLAPVSRALLCIFVLVQCTLPENQPVRAMLEFQASIEISSDIDTVFAFATNPANEPLWRHEVQRFVYEGPVQVGSAMTEFATLGFQRTYVTRAVVSQFKPPYRIVAVAASGSDRQFVGKRTFEPLSGNRTRLVYSVLADPRIVKDVVLVNVPPDLVVPYYHSIMHQNLRDLKALLEQPNN